MPKRKIQSRKAAMIKAVHCSKLYRTYYRYDQDAYKLMLKNAYGKTSSKDLNTFQLSDLLNFLNEKTKQPTRMMAPVRTGANGNVTKMISQKQVTKIEALRDLHEWIYEDGFWRWLKGRFGLERINTAAQANQVIEALKSMIEQQQRKKHGEKWKEMQHEDERLNTYIRLHG